MDVLRFTDDLLCSVIDQMRLREMYALFCTCKRLRDLSQLVGFWKRRAIVTYKLRLVATVYPDCRWEVTRYHYDLEALTYPLSGIDVWRDFTRDIEFIHSDTRYKVSKAILKLADKEQLQGVTIDRFTCRYLLAIGNPCLTEMCVKFMVSVPMDPEWMVNTLFLSNSLAGKVRKTILNRMIGEYEPIPTMVSNLLYLTDEMMEGEEPVIERVLLGLLTLIAQSGVIQFVVIDILYILRAIRLIRQRRRQMSRLRGTPLMDMYGSPTGQIFYLCDYGIYWTCARGVWCQAARQVRLF